jgi:sarcosine oxidase subunit delta
VAEFTLLGDASCIRPDGMETNLATMTDYVYFRDNPAGPYRELWYHGYGCRSWLVVERDTRTHAIAWVKLAREAALMRGVHAQANGGVA